MVSPMGTRRSARTLLERTFADEGSRSLEQGSVPIGDTGTLPLVSKPADAHSIPRGNTRTVRPTCSLLLAHRVKVQTVDRVHSH